MLIGVASYAAMSGGRNAVSKVSVKYINEKIEKKRLEGHSADHDVHVQPEPADHRAPGWFDQNL